MTKCLSIGYIPEASYIPANGFLTNIRSFEHGHDLILFSARKDVEADIILPAFTKDMTVESKYPDGSKNPWAAGTLTFLTAVRIALSKGYDYMLYLEADSRVGTDQWDRIIFDEFFSIGAGKMIGGSAVTYAACNKDRQFTMRWRDFLIYNSNSPWPIPNFGGHGAAETHEPCVLVNGAFAVYDLAFLKSIYKLTNTVQEAHDTTAFDYYIGRELSRKYGPEVFNYVAHLSSYYSGYGNVFSTEQERIQWLLDGRCVGVHQIKSAWTVTKKTLMGGVANGQVAVKSSGSEQRPVKPLTVQPPSPNPKVSIMIVTHARDAEWLKYCLASIAKFASGFLRVNIIIPAKQLFPEPMPLHENVVVHYFDQAPAPLGHLHHEAIKCMADTFDNEADYFLFVDADCLFTEPFTPAAYFHEGKALLLVESYERMKKNNDLGCSWQDPTEKALGFKCEHQTMRRLPIHAAAALRGLRRHVEHVHRVDFLQYVLGQNPTWPYGFCEFDAIGNYALRFHGQSYWIVDVGVDPHPHIPMFQRWSHGPMDKPQKVWHEGKMVEITPSQQNKDILGL